MIEIGINSEILAQILDGRKTVEGRLAKGKFLDLKPNDFISVREDIYEGNQIVEMRNSVAKLQVVNIEAFDSFEDMLVANDFYKVIPKAHNLNEACAEYSRYYTSEDEAKYGVLGISFKVPT